MEEIYLGDVGTSFEFTILDQEGNVVPLTGTGTFKLRFKRPRGERLEVPATLVTDGTDGRIRYVTVAGDIDEAGKWKVQSFVQTSQGAWSSNVHEFFVLNTL